MASFDSDIWTAGLGQQKANPKAGSAVAAAAAKEEAEEKGSGTRPPLPGSGVGSGKKGGSVLYRIFHPGSSDSEGGGHAAAAAALGGGGGGHGIFGRSRRYNSDSDFESSDDDGARSDSSSIGSRSLGRHSISVSGAKDGVKDSAVSAVSSSAVSAGAGIAASSVPRLSSGSLFTKKKKPAAADSESESETENARDLAQKTGRMSMGKILAGSRKTSISATSGSRINSSSSTSASASKLNTSLQHLEDNSSDASSRHDSDRDSSDEGAHEGGRTGGNIFKNIMNVKRRATAAAISSERSPNRLGSSSASGSAGSLAPPPVSTMPRLGSGHDSSASGGGNLSRSSSVSSVSGMQRSGSEISLNEKYGPTVKASELGRGASAVVRLCSPVNTDKKYAIKEFKPRKKGEQQKAYIKKLMSEFCISSALLHENVIRTVDLIQDDRKTWCVVMEYSEGGDLFTKIAAGLLVDKAELVNCFFKQVLKGVEYLHSMGVAHRDLKPENLLLDKACRIVKITDFGVSEVFRAPLETVSKKSEGECGSGPYMAPEVFIQKEYEADMIDVWSIGIIYYVMLYNSIPWSIAKLSDARFKHYRDSKIKFWPIARLPPHPRKIIFGMLEPDVSQRLKISTVLSSDWVKSISSCQAGMPVEAQNHSHVSLLQK